ncbi:Histidine--tRNA ligase [Phytophthora nicotianae]|uniref:Histidine--tRNA ligase n=1 Tax=Phytophthora nicotianae TaxID=4792 RepID=A0A0W8DG27_PHYNI|nr:Histidine--tRNA ligase [Phytophthora nicotianae]
MSASVAASAELHLKMCKKVAQLTKVIFQLNTRNEDYQAEAEHTREAHTAELQKLTQDAADKMRMLQGKLQTQAATAAQRERQYAAERQKFMTETQQQQRRTQAGRIAAEEAFKVKVAELETEVLDAKRHFNERVETLTQLAAEKEKQRALSSQEEAVALEARLEEMRLKHADEVEQLVTTSNAKYSKMLAEQLRAQDTLKADLVSAKLDYDKQKQEMIAEYERQRLAQEISAKTSFDEVKHELVTKIEALLLDVEALRGNETKHRDEKENFVKNQQEAARTIKQLELQLSKAQQDSQSVRRDASAHSEELQRMLAVSTDKIDELAQELTTLKQTLQTRDRALIQAQKDLEIAQLETLQQNATASELQAQLKQQLQENKLQLANSKSEIQLAFQQVETGKNQIQKLETELTAALKSIADMQTEGSNNALTQSKLKQELEHVQTEAKQVKTDHERALETLKQTYDSNIQQLISSHTHEMETQRSGAKKQLEQLEKRMKEASEKTSDEKISELKREHQRVVIEHEVASKTAQAKLRDEIVKLELQVKTLQDQLKVQTLHLTDLQKKRADLARQLENSQQQISLLQSAKDALQSSSLKFQKERDEAHQKQIRELELHRENSIKSLTADRDQLEQEHSKALIQLMQAHATTLQTTTEQLEAQRLKELTFQETTMRELYEPQLLKLREDIESLQHALKGSTEEAMETQRAMEETRLFEQEQVRSAIVRYTERTAAELSDVEITARQQLESLQLRHSNHELELEKRLKDEMKAQLASHQAKADSDFARLAAEHRQELQISAQEHAEAMKLLQSTLHSGQERAILAERADAAKQLAELSSKKDKERSEALLEAQHAHDQQYGELRDRLESTEETLTRKTLDWAGAMREGQNLSAALAAKTQEVVVRVAELEKSSREQVETLKLAAKREMDKLLEENLAETKQLSDQFEETRRVMDEKVASLKAAIAEWQDKYARRESRPEDVARIVELERLVVEKDVLVRRTLDEMAYFKRELLNREEMYNKTFARTPNVGMLQVLKPHVQMQQQMQMQQSLNPMQATPPPKSRGKAKTFEQPQDLQRRRSERSVSPPTTAALPPLHNNQFS